MIGILPLIAALVSDPSTAARVDELAAATIAALPDKEKSILTEEEAREHAAAAIAAERPGVSAELLLGIAYVETRYTANARSAGGKGRYCGVVQATSVKYGYSCKDLFDLEIGYRAGAESIERWLKVCHKRKRKLRCAVYGYGGVSVNGSVGYPGKVLRQMRRIRKELEDRISVEV